MIYVVKGYLGLRNRELFVIIEFQCNHMIMDNRIVSFSLFVCRPSRKSERSSSPILFRRIQRANNLHLTTNTWGLSQIYFLPQCKHALCPLMALFTMIKHRHVVKFPKLKNFLKYSARRMIGSRIIWLVAYCNQVLLVSV